MVRPAKSPRRKAPKEISIHMSVAAFLRWAWPGDLPWTHFPAGEKRDARTGAKLKSMGLAAGWPDFVLLLPQGRVGFIELKAKGGTLSEAQVAFRDQAMANGHGYAVCTSVEEVEAAAARWLAKFGRSLNARTMAIQPVRPIPPLKLGEPTLRAARRTTAPTPS